MLLATVILVSLSRLWSPSLVNTIVPFRAFALITTGFWGFPGAPALAITPPGTAAIGVPTFVQAGKLSCAARLNDITHLQTWCFKGSLLLYNAVQDFSAQTAAVSDFADTTVGETPAQITWLVATVAGFPGSVGYQVAIIVNGNQQSALSGVF
jgi:hypothetical protein